MTPTEADRILKLASDAFAERASRVVDLDALTMERLIFLARYGALNFKAPDEGHRQKLKQMADLPVPAVEVQTLAAYDASDRHIPDSDLDDEQPISLTVRTTLGEVRRIRRTHAMIARGAEISAEEDRARIAYEDSL